MYRGCSGPNARCRHVEVKERAARLVVVVVVLLHCGHGRHTVVRDDSLGAVLGRIVNCRVM